jgi:hypothetical protein
VAKAKYKQQDESLRDESKREQTMSTLYSIGQMNQLGDALEMAGFSAEDVTKLKQYKGLGNMLLVLSGLAEIITKPVEKVVEEAKVYLRRLFEFTLGFTNGSGTTYATAGKVFQGYFSPDFEKWGIVFSGATRETKVTVDELVRDGKFSDFLGVTATELEKCRMLGSQFLAICRDYPNKLRGEGYANFFVLTKGDRTVAEDLSNVFVADVYVFGRGNLVAYLRGFRNDDVWLGGSRRRVFSPQQ